MRATRGRLLGYPDHKFNCVSCTDRFKMVHQCDKPLKTPELFGDYKPNPNHPNPCPWRQIELQTPDIIEYLASYKRFTQYRVFPREPAFVEDAQPSRWWQAMQIVGNEHTACMAESNQGSTPLMDLLGLTSQATP